MMRNAIRSILRLAAATSLVGALAAPLAAQATPERPKWVPGEVIVKFKEGVGPAQIQQFHSAYNLKTLRRYKLVAAEHLKLPKGWTVERALATLGNLGIIDSISPNYYRYIDAIPNDSQFDQLWGMHNTGQTGGTPDVDIDAPEAWDITTGDANVVVAVIDSGMQLDHPDLAGNLYVNPGEIPGNGIDDDGNGYVDDVHGWDFVANDNDPGPAGGGCGGHGTHTAGTIGAVGNDGLGVAGVNWNVQIMPLRAFKPILVIFCGGDDAALMASVEYHTMMGVRVSSNSWGGTGYNGAMEALIRASKSVFVAAAGNDGRNNDSTPQYPASYDVDGIIAVAANDHNGALASFSNYGASVDVSAPGVGILSTLPTDSWGAFDGTSMATPHVAGIAALLLSVDPNLTVNEMKWDILNGIDAGGLPVLTGGRANAYKALQNALTAPEVAASVTSLSGSTVSPGGSVTYSASVTNTGTVTRTTKVKLYARLADGTEVSLLGPATITLAPGETQSVTQTKTVPASLAPQDVEVVAQAESDVSFDESTIVYTIVP